MHGLGVDPSQEIDLGEGLANDKTSRRLCVFSSIYNRYGTVFDSVMSGYILKSRVLWEDEDETRLYTVVLIRFLLVL